MSDWGRVSPAEIEFGKTWKKLTGEQLIPADDWFSRKTGTLFEVKGISRFPSTDFVDREVRMNLVSMKRHANPLMADQKRTVVAVKFADKWLYADVKDVLAHSHEDRANNFGDRPTLFVDFKVFRETI